MPTSTRPAAQTLNVTQTGLSAWRADAPSAKSISIAFTLTCTSAGQMVAAKNATSTRTASSRAHLRQTRIRYSATHVSLSMCVRGASTSRKSAAKQIASVGMSNSPHNATRTWTLAVNARAIHRARHSAWIIALEVSACRPSIILSFLTAINMTIWAIVPVAAQDSLCTNSNALRIALLMTHAKMTLV